MRHEVQKIAEDRLRKELAKPYQAEPRSDGVVYQDDEFDPWSLFPSLYGTYSSAFDALALDVLRDIQAVRYEREDLASELFREILCKAEFCDYGTRCSVPASGGSDLG